MITELNFDKFHIGRKLFSKLEETDLSITSVFENNYFGRLFVDNPNNPSSAFMELGRRTFLFVGSEKNTSFNESVNKEIYEKIIPQKMSEYVSKFCYFIFDENWLDVIPKIFLDCTKETRKYYVFDKLKIKNWKDLLPESYSIHKTDADFLERKEVRDSRLTIKWINEIYGSEERFLQRSHGFCLIYQNKELASNNFVNYVNNKRDRIEMGIVTNKHHQRKGLSKLLVSANLEYCLSEGLTKIGWHTNVNNIASQKTAESVGFKHERDYIIYIGQWE